MNKELNLKVQAIEQLIAETKQSLKTYANQISKHHKTLKTLSQELNSIKSQLNMKTLNNQSNSSNKSNQD